MICKVMNFSIFRHILALIVLWGHCFVLGYGCEEPFIFNGYTLREAAVAGFFAISGYLLAKSLLKKPKLSDYFKNRAIRILPGYWGVLLFSSLILAPLLLCILYPGWSYWKYLTAGTVNPLNYLTGNFFLTNPQVEIRPLFMPNIYPRIWNGSLWSLPCEAFCYVILGIISLFNLKKALPIVFISFILLRGSSIFIEYKLCSSQSFWGGTVINNTIHPAGGAMLLFFLCGSMLALYPQILKYGKFASIGLICAWIAPREIGLFILPPMLAISLIWLGNMGKYNMKHDISYGLYLYAFPVQQVLAMYKINGALYMILSFVITTILAIISWFCIEKPFLRLKNLVKT